MRKTNLMILKFPADDSKRLLYRVLVDMNLGETRRRSRRHPLLVDVVVNHDARPGAGYGLLTKKKILL